MFHPTQDNIVLNQLHFIGTGYFTHFVKREIKKALDKFGYKSAILSRVFMTKQNCIAKEKYEEMYKVNEDSEERDDLSVGENLETFLRKIKDGKMNTISRILNSLWSRNMFLLCLLDKDERKKLEQKDETFMKTFNLHYIGKADVPESEWNESESNLKFALSHCQRRTFFIVV